MHGSFSLSFVGVLSVGTRIKSWHFYSAQAIESKASD